MAAIDVENLTKRYGDTAVVDALSFGVERGRVTAFLGPNGAGKSTTLKMILGLVEPTSGSAHVLGAPYRALGDAAGRRVGALLDAADVHPRRQGRDHLRIAADLLGVPTSRVDDALRVVDLSPADARKKVGAYSLGMRQRLGIAAALLGEPEVLVLDEPANGLDPHGMRWLRSLLRNFAARGGAVLISSHLLAEVAEIADDVVVIANGRLVARVPIAELTAASSLEEAFFRLTDGNDHKEGMTWHAS